MGILSSKGEQPKQADSLIAKNYCTEDELSAFKNEILTHAGKISAKTAELKAKEEYKKYKALHLEDVSKVEKDYIKALEDMEMKLLGKE